MREGWRQDEGAGWKGGREGAREGVREGYRENESSLEELKLP